MLKNRIFFVSFLLFELIFYQVICNLQEIRLIKEENEQEIENIINNSTEEKKKLDNVTEKSTINITNIPNLTSKTSRVYNPLKVGEKFILPFFNATADNSYKYIGKDGIQLFTPEHAIKRGLTHWLSDGNAIQTDIVVFTGNLLEPRTASGVIINWAATPSQVKIETSEDGIIYKEAIPWTVNRFASKEMEQKLYFKSNVVLNSVKILMKGQLYNFFGINFVGLISSTAPIVQLTSGLTTSTEEFCWQIENGEIYVKGSELILGNCIEAIAYGDSREIFGFNKYGQLFNPESKLCVQLKDNISTSGGKFILEDCKIANDGRGLFELLPNNQLRLLRGGNLCLSSPGDKPGIINIALNAAASSDSIRTNEPEYGPSMAIDGKDTTYWLSNQLSPHENTIEVNFIVDIGENVKIQDIFIDWIYNAKLFSISISNDNEIYESVINVKENGLKSTGYSFDGRKARYIKINMKEPNEELMYGIKQIRVYSNTMRSVAEDCSSASLHKDGRDKIFPVPFNGESFATGLSFKSNKNLIKIRLNELQEMSGKATSLLPLLETCIGTANGRENVLKNQIEKVGILSEQLENIELEYNLKYKFTKPPIGDSELFPSEDCVNIFNYRKNAISGFYYIRPFCASKPIRVFCDKNSGNTIYPLEITIDTPRKISSLCSSYGLKPLLLRDKKSTINGIKLMLKIMGVENNRRVIPITHDYECDGNDTCKAVHFLEKDTEVYNLDNSDSKMSDIVLCSTNTNFSHANDAINLSCESRFSDIKALSNSPLLSTILVKCPINCSLSEGGAVIGTDVYRDDSSVCLSAMHANTLNRKSGLLHLTPIEGLNSYGGSKRFGINSIAYSGNKWEKSYVTSKYEGLCSYEDQLSMLLSFVQISNSYNQTTDLIINNSNTSYKPKIDINDSISKLTKYINASIGGTIHQSALRESIKQSQILISKIRGKLKPTQITDYHSKLVADDTLMKINTISNVIYFHMESLLQETITEEELLDQIKKLKTTQTGFDTFKMPHNKVTFGTIFEQHNTPNTYEGIGNWRLIYEPIGGISRGITLAQTSGVGSHDIGGGTICKLKNKKFYDIELNTNMYIDSYEGAVGIIFRLLNYERYYLLEFRQTQSGGYKRIIKIFDGEKKVLSTKYDGGFISNTWYKIKIELIGPRIKVWITEDDRSQIKLFDLYDSNMLSGTIGFYSNKINGGLYFDSIYVKSMPCNKPISIIMPPKSPECSNYKSDKFGGINNEFVFIDPDYSNDGPSSWEFRENIGGLQTRSLVQTSNIWTKNKEGTHAILTGNRQCKNGVFQYSFFPQCSDGIIGGIIRYNSPSNYVIFEMSSYYSRIRFIRDGIANTISINMLVGYQLGIWNNIEINFGVLGINILASTNNYGKTQLLYTGNPIGISDGSVGLSSYKCPGVAFQSISLHPLTITKTISSLFIDKQNQMDIKNKLKPEKNIEYNINLNSKITNETKTKEMNNCLYIDSKDVYNNKCKVGQDKSKLNELICFIKMCNMCCETYSSELDKKDINRCKLKCLLLDGIN